MARIRIHVLLVIALLLAAVGVALNTGGFLTGHSYQDSYVDADSVHAEMLPPDSHITGYILAEHPFSVYVVNSDSGYFEGVNGHNVMMSWENVTNVSLDFNTSNGTQYLVVKNGNVSQEIDVVVNAER